MFSIPLLKREIKSNYKLFVVIILVLTMYMTIIISMFDPNLGSILQEFAEKMPEVFAAFGMNAPATTLTEFLVTYLYGFFMVLFPMIFEIMIANKLVSRYVENGSMTYLLATPNKRSKLIRTQVLFLWGSLIVLFTYLTVYCIVCSSIMFPNNLDITPFIIINLAALVLHIAISGIAFAASSIANDAKTSYLFGAGLPILFYIIQMMANMGGKLENLKYATLLTLYQPNDIIQGVENYLIPLIILFVLGSFLYFIGSYIFTKKDLSV